MTSRIACAAIAAALLTAARLAASTPEDTAAESAKANAFFDRVFDAAVDRNPELQTQLGIKKDYGEWTDLSDARAAEELSIALKNLAELQRTINYDALDPQTQVSYRLFVRNAERAAEGFKWRHHNYPVNQMFGLHSGTPAFLINFHRIDSADDAAAYINRLYGIKRRFAQLVDNLETRRELGIVPPRFVFPLVLESCRNLITGEPFDTSGQKNALLEDFEKKLAGVKDLDDERRAAFLASARTALVEQVKPAYETLIAKLEALEQIATDDDGVWKFPQGADYYNYALRQSTTTHLTADEIHEIGLAEVARIHREMEKIMKQVKFKGDLPAFFKFMREDPRFYYPNTPENKEVYLAEATRVIDAMREKLDTLFLTKPKAAIVVKAVEPFREKESGGAFYQQPALDGSRPGTYYVNLYDLSAAPKYEIEALAFHEGLPGHHMQIAIAQELTGVPKFRKLSFGYTAYVEGWGLYSEQLGKEVGFYQDPYSDFGRLSMELWRAARLVVDTGLHSKKWTRAETMAWLRKNTPNSERDITTETNRYIVMAGQATAYKVGMLKILELREKAKRALGPKFDLREFHDIVLCSGALPLDVLEEQVQGWITTKRQA